MNAPDTRVPTPPKLLPVMTDWHVQHVTQRKLIAEHRGLFHPSATNEVEANTARDIATVLSSLVSGEVVPVPRELLVAWGELTQAEIEYYDAGRAMKGMAQEIADLLSSSPAPHTPEQP